MIYENEYITKVKGNRYCMNCNRSYETADEKQAREIDECRDIDELKQMLKTSIKLYLKQQEVISTMGIK